MKTLTYWQTNKFDKYGNVANITYLKQMNEQGEILLSSFGGWYTQKTCEEMLIRMRATARRN